jgi:preprotein translocase subunit SecE
MARNRQKAKQRKAKRLAHEQRQAGAEPEAKPSSPKVEAKPAEPSQPDRAEQRLEEIEQEHIGQEAMAGTGIASEVELDQARMDAELAEPEQSEQEPRAEAQQPHVEAPKRERKRGQRAEKAAAEKKERKRGDERKQRKPQKQQRQKSQSQPRERGRVVNFFRQVWAELKRVQWPTRDQVFQATGVVVAFCVIAGVYLAGLDFVWSELVDRLF